jgi:drug/metabolite transporter (DMT)-like permease
MGAAVLALLGAASWGVGDFFGGLAARKAHVLTVLVGSQAVGLAGAAVWVVVSSDAPPALEDVLPAVGAGACGALGLAALYRGMAVGAMGIVAPISAASPVVPLAVDLTRGVSPSALQWVGIAVVLGGITLLAREPGGTRSAGLAAGVALALAAALAFGLFVVGLDAAADGGVPWTILAVRSTSTLLALTLALVASVALVPPARLVPAVLAVGVFDTSANVLVAFATTRGSAGVVAVLSALYPVVTILLARVALGERLDRPRRVGGALALGGAAAVAAG